MILAVRITFCVNCSNNAQAAMENCGSPEKRNILVDVFCQRTNYKMFYAHIIFHRGFAVWVLYCALLYCTDCMTWYGMVWYGMVWYGMVWYGMVWYGMVWYGMV